MKSIIPGQKTSRIVGVARLPLISKELKGDILYFRRLNLLTFTQAGGRAVEALPEVGLPKTVDADRPAAVRRAFSWQVASRMP
jgi:hypothetical protein